MGTTFLYLDGQCNQEDKFSNALIMSCDIKGIMSTLSSIKWTNFEHVRKKRKKKKKKRELVKGKFYNSILYI